MIFCLNMPFFHNLQKLAEASTEEKIEIWKANIWTTDAAWWQQHILTLVKWGKNKHITNLSIPLWHQHILCNQYYINNPYNNKMSPVKGKIYKSINPPQYITWMSTFHGWITTNWNYGEKKVIDQKYDMIGVIYTLYNRVLKWPLTFSRMVIHTSNCKMTAVAMLKLNIY